jgi:DNA-binding MarR family transcriptional regulator
MSVPTNHSSLTDGRSDFNVVFIHSLLDNFGLSASQFRVYAHLARRAGIGAAWPAVASIALTCLLHPQTVRRALAFLTKQKLITRQPRPGHTPLYRLTPATQWLPLSGVTRSPCKLNTPASDTETPHPKAMEGHPCESDGAKGYPVGGHPQKSRPHTPSVRQIPCNEAEAEASAILAGIPAEFARTEFNRMEAVNWLDGCQRPVYSWPHYLKQRWCNQQSDRAKRKVGPAARLSRNGAPIPPRKFNSTDYEQSLDKF